MGEHTVTELLAAALEVVAPYDDADIDRIDIVHGRLEVMAKVAPPAGARARSVRTYGPDGPYPFEHAFTRYDFEHEGIPAEWTWMSKTSPEVLAALEADPGDIPPEDFAALRGAIAWLEARRASEAQ